MLCQLSHEVKSFRVGDILACVQSQTPKRRLVIFRNWVYSSFDVNVF
jgi:hypothetical protein